MALCSDSRNIPLAVASSKFLISPSNILFISELSKFTITSAPEDPYVSIHIRQVGDFTQALGERLGVGPSVVVSMTQAALKGFETDIKGGTRGDFVELDQTASPLPLPTIRIDGPYGAPAEDVFNAQVAVLIGAGIGEQIRSWIYVVPSIKLEGVTPFASILKHIWYRQKRQSLGTLRRVEFFWICRDAPSFGWFQSLLQEVEAAQADREEYTAISFPCPDVPAANFLRINIYLTQNVGEDMLWNIAVNDAGAEYDPLTLLRSRTIFGRPDWMAIYGKMRQAIESGQYIPGSKSQLKTKVGVSIGLPPPVNSFIPFFL